jgi:hypothetical protein
MVEPEDHPPINTNNSEVEDRYPIRSRISKLKIICKLYTGCVR